MAAESTPRTPGLEEDLDLLYSMHRDTLRALCEKAIRETVAQADEIARLTAERDALREAGDLALNALDELLGDSDFPEDDRPGVLAMQALCRVLNPEGADR